MKKTSFILFSIALLGANQLKAQQALGKQFTQGVMMNDILKPNTTIWMHPVADSALLNTKFK